MTDAQSTRAASHTPTHTPSPANRVAPGSPAQAPPDGSTRSNRSGDSARAVARLGDDAQPDKDLLRSGATCTMAWRVDGFEAIELFVDPALGDRAAELCAAIEGWSGVHRDLEDLSDEILQYAGHEGLSVGIYPRPRDDVSAGLVAIAITID